MSQDFKKINDGFTCVHCRIKVVPARRTCRDHCPMCLYSLHVDIIPGDRKEVCQGLLVPIDYDIESGNFVIVYKCEKCGKKIRNKAADDDDVDQILYLKN